MFDELKKYKNNGHFFFTIGNKLINASKDVPELPGIYYIISLSNNKVDLVYIGKSGTISQSGIFKDQLLKGRINNKSNGIRRQQFFEQKMVEGNIHGLDVYWFVTMDKNNNDLPGYVEGLLMQRYFDIHGKLPPWNKCF